MLALFRRTSFLLHWREINGLTGLAHIIFRENMFIAYKFVLPLVLVLNFNVLLFGQNWPQWRGVALDNISLATDVPVEFNKDKNMLWRVEMPGPGGASPIVWEDKIFVTTVVKASDELQLICFHADGTQAWARTLKGSNKSIRMDSANSASPSPSTDGNHVWATTCEGYLECFDMDGNPVWSVDLQDRYGKFNIQFGMTSTPILHDGRLYLQMIHGKMRGPGGSVGHVAALDASNGEEIWHHVRETDAIAENRHSYASPVLAHNGEVSQLVTHGGDFVIGHSLQDGKEMWRCGGLNPKGDQYNPYLRFVSSPTFADGKLFVPSAKNGPVICLTPELSGDVTDDQEARKWTLKRGTPDVACPVYHDGLVYLARENGAMLVLDSESGEQVYMERMMSDRHRSTPVVADGKVYITGRKGNVYVLQAGREAKLLAENELGEFITASPAIVDGRIYIRTWDALYCFGNKQ